MKRRQNDPARKSGRAETAVPNRAAKNRRRATATRADRMATRATLSDDSCLYPRRNPPLSPSCFALLVQHGRDRPAHSHEQFIFLSRCRAPEHHRGACEWHLPESFDVPQNGNPPASGLSALDVAVANSGRRAVSDLNASELPCMSRLADGRAASSRGGLAGRRGRIGPGGFGC
jgi:hypothetical protein